MKEKLTQKLQLPIESITFESQVNGEQSDTLTIVSDNFEEMKKSESHAKIKEIIGDEIE
jgi:stress-induced morphogen